MAMSRNQREARVAHLASQGGVLGARRASRRASVCRRRRAIRRPAWLAQCLVVVAAVAGPHAAFAAAGVLPEVVIAVDTSESMQTPLSPGPAPDCSTLNPGGTRWTATLQMLLGTIGAYKCIKDTAAAHPDATSPPKQLIGAKTCIGGIAHVIAENHLLSASGSLSEPIGVKSWSGTIANASAYLRLLTTTNDAAVPYFAYDADAVPTGETWVTGALKVVTKDKSTLTSADVWAYLVSFDKNPAGQNGKVFVCDLMTQLKSKVVSAPVKIANTGGGVTVFPLSLAYLKAMQTAAKGGQKAFYFAVITQKAWFKADCSGRGDDLSEQVDLSFHGPGAPWSELRPQFAIDVGKQCKREGPGVHYAPVGAFGTDGVLSKYANAAKFSLLVSDTVLSVNKDATGGYSFGNPFGSYWGNVNLGGADPFVSGTDSVPMPRADTSAARLNSIAAITTNLPTIKPVGGTPLAALIEDIAAYFGPDKNQDPHFQSLSVDPKNGDPYYECRTRFALLITDGGANLHTGASDGRAAAVQAAALLLTRGVALYVVVPGSKNISKEDLDFADEIAAAGGTANAWRVETAADLTKALKGVLQTAGTTGEVLTPTVYTSSTGSDQDVQHSFHAMSNFDITEPMQSWGVLEQRFFGCESACVDAKTPGRAQVCSVVDYGWKLENRSAARRMYTHVGGARRTLTSTSISPDDLNITKVGLAPKLQLDASNNCTTKPNTFNLSNPLERAQYAVDVLAQVRGDKGSCRANRQLGAVGFARPVVLGGADQIALRDPSFRAFAARDAPGSADYSTSVRPGSTGRPTLLFASTHEGMMHAFRSDRDAAVTTKDSLVAGDELWGWLPLFNLQRVRQLKLVADADRSFLGGGLVAGHVQLTRLGNTVSELSDNWRSVVVAGAGEAGSGYFALDVTSADDPRLLWEISPAHHCFGSGSLGAAKGPKCLLVNTYEGLGRSTATPVLASAYVTFQGVTTPRAVAIIAGGKPPLDSAVQNAGADGTGERAVWIVDMATGALIRKLTTADMDLTGTTVTVNSKTKDLGYFWTEPACYDVAPGQLVSRCFIGDSKGMVWRIDVSDANPSKWKLTFFHDAYSAADTPSSLVQNIKGSGRVPVLSPPVLSTDTDGSLVVVYGTGGLKDAAKLSRRHIVFSVKEKLTLGANGVAAKIEAGALWMKVMTESTRYVGPPTIFSRNAYFSSYTISASGVCSTGTGRMWGAHYTRLTTPTDPESIIGAFPSPTSDASSPSLSGKTLTNLVVGSDPPSPIEIVPVPACVAGCTPTDLKCLIKAKKSAASAGKPTFEANVSVATKTQGKYQSPTSGSQPKVGTITRGLSTPRSTTVITGWDLLLD